MNPILLPVVGIQAARVQRHTVALPEAAGPQQGTTVAGTSVLLRVAIAGESTAAGCGAATHDEAFAGHLARHLAETMNATVRWEIHARNGATMRQIRSDLAPAISPRVDAVVLLAGVNDVLRRTPLASYAHDLSATLSVLRERAPLVFLTGVPSFDSFPTLPRLLGRYLLERGDRLDHISRLVCAETPGVLWVGSRSPLTAAEDFFAIDGFHPSSSGYRAWARQVGRTVGDVLVAQRQPMAGRTGQA